MVHPIKHTCTALKKTQLIYCTLIIPTQLDQHLPLPEHFGHTRHPVLICHEAAAAGLDRTLPLAQAGHIPAARHAHPAYPARHPIVARQRLRAAEGRDLNLVSSPILMISLPPS